METWGRLFMLRMLSNVGHANIICAYAPTLQANSEVKDQFYESLSEIIQKIPSSESIYLLGHFNARDGADHSSWSDCMGKHGVGKISDNGQRLLELRAQYRLCITSTGRHRRKVPWRHARSGHWHQLDHIITKREDLTTVAHTRTYHSADCDTDHSVIKTKVNSKENYIQKSNTTHQHKQRAIR